MRVSDYMSPSPVTIREDEDYGSAFEMMQQGDLHHLPVIDAKGGVVGIVTRRDLQLAARHYQDAPVEVSEVMHAPVETITAQAGLASAAKRMTALRIGCLPVVDRRKRVVGMITETDLFRALGDALRTKKPVAAKKRKVPAAPKARTTKKKAVAKKKK